MPKRNRKTGKRPGSKYYQKIQQGHNPTSAKGIGVRASGNEGLTVAGTKDGTVQCPGPNCPRTHQVRSGVFYCTGCTTSFNVTPYEEPRGSWSSGYDSYRW